MLRCWGGGGAADAGGLRRVAEGRGRRVAGRGVARRASRVASLHLHVIQYGLLGSEMLLRSDMIRNGRLFRAQWLIAHTTPKCVVLHTQWFSEFINSLEG